MRRGKFHYVLKSSPGVCWWRNIFVQDQHVTNRSRISISNGWGNQRWRKGDWIQIRLAEFAGKINLQCFRKNVSFQTPISDYHGHSNEVFMTSLLYLPLWHQSWDRMTLEDIHSWSHVLAKFRAISMVHCLLFQIYLEWATFVFKCIRDLVSVWHNAREYRTNSRPDQPLFHSLLICSKYFLLLTGACSKKICYWYIIWFICRTC